MKHIFLLLLLTITGFSYAQEDVIEEITTNEKDSLIYAFALEMEDAFYTNDSTFFTNNFNKKAFTDYFLETDETNEELTGFNTAFTAGMGDVLLKFYKRVSEAIENGTSYNLVNYSEDDEGNYYLTYRFYGDDGLNYHEYYIANLPDDKIEISDVFIMMTGEFLSETLRPMYLSAISDYIDYDVDTEGQLSLNNIFMLKKVKDFYQAGKLENAKNLLARFPEDVQDNKLVLLYKLLVFDEEDEEYT